MEKAQELAVVVAGLVAVIQSGPLSFVIIELLKRVGMRNALLIRTCAVLTSVAVAVAICAYMGIVPLQLTPIVGLLAWGMAEGTHRLRNANEAVPPPSTPSPD